MGLYNVIDYWTFSSLGNAADFGDLSAARTGTHEGSGSNGTRGLCCGGYESGNVDTVEYVNFASTGNATDFGNLSAARRETAGANNDTRLCLAGGLGPASNLDIIEYFTMGTTGNATDFGDLDNGDEGSGSTSNGTRAVFKNGNDDQIQAYNIASLGNATDFGNHTTDGTYFLAGCSDLTKGVFGGGYGTPAGTDTMDYVNIASTGDAADFGDLTVARYGLASASGT